MVDDRFELRPNWTVVAVLLCSSATCFLIVLTVWFTSTRTPGAWAMMTAALLVGLLALVTAARMRLTLTAHGFRYRHLWEGRFVHWWEVREFLPDVAPLGAYWLPATRPPMPRSAWSWWIAMSDAQARHIPLFGRSRAFLVETLNTWLERAASTPPAS